MPARISVSDDPRGPASDKTRKTPTSAPVSADKGSANATVAATPVWIDKTAPNAAEPDTPINPGSASGLRKYPCIAAPAMPRLAPISTARIARGNRISRITSVKAPPLSTTKARRLSTGPMSAGPNTSAALKSRASRAVRTTINRVMIHPLPTRGAALRSRQWRSTQTGCHRPSRGR